MKGTVIIMYLGGIISKIKRFINKSILNKLLVSFVVIIISPILIISYFSFNRLTESIKTTYNNDNIYVLKNIDNTLQMYFDDFDRLTYNAFISYDIQSILINNSNNINVEYANQQRFDNFVENLIGDRNDIEGVYLVCKNKNIYYKTSYGDVKLNYDITGEPWFKTIEESNGKFVIVGSHAQGYKENVTLRYELTVARKIKDLNTGETIGYFLIEIKPDVFYNIFKSINLNDWHITIVGKDGNIVFDPVIFDQNNTNYIVKKGDTIQSITNKYKIPINEFVKSNGIQPNTVLTPGQFVEIDGVAVKFKDLYSGVGISSLSNGVKTETSGEKYLITKYYSPLGWTFMESTPVNTLFKQINSITTPIVVISLLCFVTFIIAAYLISRNIARPIKVLKKSIKRVELGDFDHKTVLNCGGEIQSLAEDFNIMVVKIQNLIHEVYESQVKELDAEFKALQAQINPHFLYNTLESINCLAQLKDENEISQMIQGLAKIFRYTISKDMGDVTLGDEINHAKNFILLQAIRYEDKITIQYNIPERLLKAKVIKLILQPLVENAIYHGTEKVSRRCVIKINAEIRQESLLIAIIDNGAGIDLNKLKKLKVLLKSDLNELSKFDKENSSIGIINIHSRIKLKYGKQYGLEIDSVEGEGTTVNLVLPFEEGGLANV